MIYFNYKKYIRLIIQLKIQLIINVWILSINILDFDTNPKCVYPGPCESTFLAAASIILTSV